MNSSQPEFVRSMRAVIEVLEILVDPALCGREQESDAQNTGTNFCSNCR